jgi:hypothetical protein
MSRSSTSPLLDYAALKARGTFRSRATLHRALNRDSRDNPFPKPLRHTLTGRRYWREDQVSAWEERERERRALRVQLEDLLPDEDPARWAPSGRTRAAAHPRVI